MIEETDRRAFKLPDHLDAGGAAKVQCVLTVKPDRERKRSDWWHGIWWWSEGAHKS